MKKIFSIIIGVTGLSFLVIIHELGHLIAAKLYGVAAPLFSIGFGPKIIGIQLGETFYQLSLLPLGGYVSLNEAQLSMQPFGAQAIILLAGVGINLLFAYGLFAWFSLRKLPCNQMMQSISQEQGITSRFVGPITIILLIGYSATRGIDYLLMVLATTSFSIGIFNLLPIPFLDGGALFAIAHEAMQKSFPDFTYGNQVTAMLLILSAMCFGVWLIIQIGRFIMKILYGLFR